MSTAVFVGSRTVDSLLPPAGNAREGTLRNRAGHTHTHELTFHDSSETRPPRSQGRRHQPSGGRKLRAGGQRNDLLSTGRVLKEEGGEGKTRQCWALLGGICHRIPGDGIERHGSERMGELIEDVHCQLAFLGPTGGGVRLCPEHGRFAVSGLGPSRFWSNQGHGQTNT